MLLLMKRKTTLDRVETTRR